MTADQFKQLLEQNNAVFFGQLTKYLDGQVKEVTDRLDKHDVRFSQIMSSLDQLLKQSETGDQEQAIEPYNTFYDDHKQM